MAQRQLTLRIRHLLLSIRDLLVPLCDFSGLLRYLAGEVFIFPNQTIMIASQLLLAGLVSVSMPLLPALSARTANRRRIHPDYVGSLFRPRTESAGVPELFRRRLAGEASPRRPPATTRSTAASD